MLGNVNDPDPEFIVKMLQREQAQLDFARVSTLLESAIAHQNKVDTQFREYEKDSILDRRSFFEKVAIGAGATLAAITSFLGAKAHTLEPRWALRACALSLFAMAILALVRNFRYPFFLHAVRQTERAQAEREVNKYRAQWILVNPESNISDTGESVDPKAYFETCNKNVLNLAEKIAELDKSRKRNLFVWKWCERLCVVSFVIAVTLLVVLVWHNF